MIGATSLFQDNYLMKSYYMQYGWTFYMGYGSASYCFLSFFSIIFGRKYLHHCTNSYEQI